MLSFTICGGFCIPCAAVGCACIAMASPIAVDSAEAANRLRFMISDLLGCWSPPRDRHREVRSGPGKGYGRRAISRRPRGMAFPRHARPAKRRELYETEDLASVLWLDDQGALHPGMLFAMIRESTRGGWCETEGRLGRHVSGFECLAVIGADRMNHG